MQAVFKKKGRLLVFRQEGMRMVCFFCIPAVETTCVLHYKTPCKMFVFRGSAAFQEKIFSKTDNYPPPLTIDGGQLYHSSE